MKLYFLVVIFAFFLLNSSAPINGQSTTSSAAGTVRNKDSNNSESKKTTSLISKTDFNNYTYPVPDIGTLEKSFTLKNGTAAKKGGLPNFTMRKTYYFDLTGDKADEAITHIVADGCQMGCESSSLFYVYIWENNKPKLIWKIAIGGDVLGGLKTAHFCDKEVVIETFGDCSLEDWLIRTNIDLSKNPKLKTTTYSRFQFTFENGMFSSPSKTVLPLDGGLNFNNYRPQITFGETD